MAAASTIPIREAAAPVEAKPQEPDQPKREARPASPASFKLREQVNNTWRHAMAEGVTAADLESDAYFGAMAEQLSDWDSVLCIEHGRRKAHEVLIVMGGRDATRGVGSGRAKGIVVHSYDIPAINRNSNDGLPEQYSIYFDGDRNAFIPFWGGAPLWADGYPTYEAARTMILGHARQATRTL